MKILFLLMKIKGYFLEVDVQYLEKLHDLYNDLPFLAERMKALNIEKLVADLHDESEYVIHIRNLKQALNHGLVLKKVHRMIKCDPNVWLKPYIDEYWYKKKKRKLILKKILLS